MDIAGRMLGGERYLRSAVLETADLRPGEQALDLCCGTGTMTAMIADIVGASGSVVGVDASRAMLSTARRKCGAPNTRLFLSSADAFDFPDSSFDVAFVCLGLHEMSSASRRATLTKCRGLLKRNGRLVVADWHNPHGVVSSLAFRAAMMAFCEPRDVFPLSKGSLLSEIREAGFAVREKRLLCGDWLICLRAHRGPALLA